MNLHMITRTHDIQTLWSKLSLDIAVQPIVCTEITNENDMLKSHSVSVWETKNQQHTDMGLWAFPHWSITALTMQVKEGSKNLATSELRGQWIQASNKNIGRFTNPCNFSSPKRILYFSSVSLVEPNLMYWKSLESLNLSFVVLSKHLTICSRSSWNGEPERKSDQNVE